MQKFKKRDDIMTDEEYKNRLELERSFMEIEIKKILFTKLKEMAALTPDDFEYSCNDYAITCSAMGEIAKVILGIT